jgi:hypothetical protein
MESAYAGDAGHAIGLLRWTSPAASGTVAWMRTTLNITAALILALAGCAAPPSEHEDAAATLREPKNVAFFFASPVEKAAIVRSHFTRYAARPGLTEAQRAACLGMVATVSEVGFGPRDTPEWAAWATHDAGEVDAVRAAFGDDLEAVHDVLFTID